MAGCLAGPKNHVRQGRSSHIRPESLYRNILGEFVVSLALGFYPSALEFQYDSTAFELGPGAGYPSR